MIPILCTTVCTLALVAIAVMGFLVMRKIKSCEANGMTDAKIKIAIAPIIRASFGTIAVFVLSAAIFLIQGI